MDKKLVFMAFNMLATVLALGILIGSFFIDNVATKNTAVIAAFAIMILQKIAEIIVIKETRKISIVILIILVIAGGFFGYKL